MTFEQWLKEAGYDTLYTSVIDAMELAWNAAKQHGYTGKGDSDRLDTTTQNVLTRVTNKGPLPPPVVDFSTDHCATCGEVLNQCKCPQVLQRVDFNEELEAENRQLKAQLRKAKCCGRCMHGTEMAYLFCEKLKENKSVRDSCDQWEVRE